MSAHEDRGWESVSVDSSQGCSQAWVVVSDTGSVVRAGSWPAPTWAARAVGTVGQGHVVDEVLVVDPTVPGGASWAGCADVLVRAAAEDASAADAWAARVLEIYPGAGLAGTVSPDGGVRGLRRDGQALQVLSSDAAGAGNSWERGVAPAALVALYARWCVEPLLAGETSGPGVVLLPRSTWGEPNEVGIAGEAVLWLIVESSVG